MFEPSVPLGQWNGGPVDPWVTCVRADNPGVMTLDGTNTWVVSKPGSGKAVIVDPGPASETHWQNVADLLTSLGVDWADGGVEGIVITHHHTDHTAGIDLFHGRTAAPVHAFTAEHRRAGGAGDFAQADPVAPNGEYQLELADMELVLIPVPGHTRDSIAILLPERKLLLTGDTILGRGTTVVAYPDGNLSEYLDSLQRLRELVVEHEVAQVLPGHGPATDKPLAAIDFYLEHRRERLAQVRQYLAELDVAPEVDKKVARKVVEQVYADVPERLWPAATLSVLAQLEYLAD